MKIKSIWIEAEQWAPGQWTPGDDNTDVVVTLEDGTRWAASFYSYRNISSLAEKNRRTGECLGGKFLWSPHMLLADEVSRERIEEIAAHLAAREPRDFESIFERLAPGAEQEDS